MKQYIYFFAFVAVSTVSLSAPLVQNVVNKSDVDFAVVHHSDRSDCSLHNCGAVVKANSVFKKDFLLERGNPSLIFRPIVYTDRATGHKVMLVDQNKNIDDTGVQKAFDLWKQSNKCKFKNAQDWLTHWVGGDIEVKPHSVEVFGYLLNLSRIRVQNNSSHHAQWMSFAKGIFSRLVLELDIHQHKKKGVVPYLKVVAGEGGVCLDGAIERL